MMLESEGGRDKQYNTVMHTGEKGDEQTGK